MSALETHVTHVPDASRARAPLSLQQEFLRLFDRGEGVGAFGPRYHHVDGWHVRGRIDVGTLQAALDDVVARHEALRTSLVRDEDGWYQGILPPGPSSLLVRDLPEAAGDDRDRRVQELLNEVEAGTFDPRRQPLLRAILVRFGDRDALLMLNAHHLAIDSWSMQLILRDLAARYAARRGHAVPALPRARQYREYAADQLAGSADAAVLAAREYWREKLRGARLLAMPTDLPRSAGSWETTSWHRVSTGEDLRAATARFAAATRSSPFMVLLAAYKVLLHEMTGTTDIVVPTFTPGRNEARFQDTVGSFFNFVPLRTDLAGCRTFRDVVGRVRATCVEAYANEIPLLHVLAEAPELMAPALGDDLAPWVFQVVQPPLQMDGELIGDLEYSAIWRRELSQETGSYVPDGMLWCLHLGPSGGLLANLAFSRGLIREDRVGELAAEFFRTLGAGISDPDGPLHRLPARTE
ncbi:condensation domain-containing protein [Streptosporangium sp. NPDC051022]|uniref:condensation domain-containing protein n=1 Tax=Streptosporangium sp. NPDC051022 TaxID=3155752 RepID=UPI0034415C73